LCQLSLSSHRGDHAICYPAQTRGHRAGAVVTKRPGDPVEFEGRNAYFADPEENYWEVVYLKNGPPPTTTGE
jgi:hypothetical protein